MSGAPDQQQLAAVMVRPLCFLEFELRAIRQDQAGELHQAILDSVETVGRWLSWCHAGYTLAEAEARIQRDEISREHATAFEFGIFETMSGRLAGVCGINCLVWQNGTANLGYWIRQGYAGRGIASEAVRILARFGFELGLSRIEIVAAETNIASRRVAEKSGAVFEAVLRNRLKDGAVPVAGALYALFPD